MANRVKDELGSFICNPHEVHLWRAELIIALDHEPEYLALLSPDEIKRAERFRFPIHRQRYIAARGILRRILSCYLGVNAKDIEFRYRDRGKPYVDYPDLEFNISHSHEMAVFAITTTAPIGVDVEKMEKIFKESVAKRFFSEKEYAELMKLKTDNARIEGFYCIWARKEAIIKGLGEGLHFPLGSFSVSAKPEIQQLKLTGKAKWHLQNFDTHKDYQAAFATQQKVKKIINWNWTMTGPMQLLD
jgi:4'-phosphopantetheinyl transferase